MYIRMQFLQLSQWERAVGPKKEGADMNLKQVHCCPVNIFQPPSSKTIRARPKIRKQFTTCNVTNAQNSLQMAFHAMRHCRIWNKLSAPSPLFRFCRRGWGVFLHGRLQMIAIGWSGGPWWWRVPHLPRRRVHQRPWMRGLHRISVAPPRLGGPKGALEFPQLFTGLALSLLLFLLFTLSSTGWLGQGSEVGRGQHRAGLWGHSWKSQIARQ